MHSRPYNTLYQFYNKNDSVLNNSNQVTERVGSPPPMPATSNSSLSALIDQLKHSLKKIKYNKSIHTKEYAVNFNYS